jgi:diadenosine tetraphosphate (Ap4A) HIT family hydrolase
MTTKSGRAIDRRMPLPLFLTKLTCNERACGEKPIHLHLIARTPGPPGQGFGQAHRWMMDARGQWTYQGTIGAED